jgi:hypothetical protein
LQNSPEREGDVPQNEMKILSVGTMTKITEKFGQDSIVINGKEGV